MMKNKRKTILDAAISVITSKGYQECSMQDIASKAGISVGAIYSYFKIYDQRSHGENTAKTVSFGLYESNDLKQVVQYVAEKYDYEMISILGQSMGASTVAYYSGTEHAKENVRCVIIDSAYTTMSEEVSWEITKTRNSMFGETIAQYGSIFSKIINGFAFEDVDLFLS